MSKKRLAPDFIFESSWEVCNKVGGIYTVLSTRAKTLQEQFPDRIIFIGPDFGNRMKVRISVRIPRCSQNGNALHANKV